MTLLCEADRSVLLVVDRADTPAAGHPRSRHAARPLPPTGTCGTRARHPGARHRTESGRPGPERAAAARAMRNHCREVSFRRRRRVRLPRATAGGTAQRGHRRLRSARLRAADDARLLESGYAVKWVADAVGSRRVVDRDAATARARAAGADIVTTEMVLFEWLRTSRHPKFRALLDALSAEPPSMLRSATTIRPRTWPAAARAPCRPPRRDRSPRRWRRASPRRGRRRDATTPPGAAAIGAITLSTPGERHAAQDERHHGAGQSMPWARPQAATTPP